jgi:hypothetical protein
MFDEGFALLMTEEWAKFNEWGASRMKGIHLVLKYSFSKQAELFYSALTLVQSSIPSFRLSHPLS